MLNTTSGGLPPFWRVYPEARRRKKSVQFRRLFRSSRRKTSEERPQWQKLFVCCMTTRLMDIPRNMLATVCRNSNATRAAQTLPTPKSIDFTPGQLLGSVSGELGLRQFLESQGHTLVVTSDKDGAGSRLDKELPDAEIVISQPFWPAYLTARHIARAPKLQAGDHRGNRLGPHRFASCD